MATKKLAKTTTAKAAIDQVNAARSSADHIGDLCWWDPVNGWSASVDHVRAVFLKHGLDPKTDLPDSPDWSTAFGRGLRRVRTELTARDFQLIDAAPGPNGERRVGIVKIARNGKVSTEDQGTLTCPKDGAAAFVERHDPSGVGAETLAVARGLVGVFMVEDVRNGVARILERCGAMPCRQAPPHIVYWIPPTAADVVRRLADAVEELGWGRMELFAGYASDPRSKRACVSAVNQGLETQLSEFAAAADEYASQTAKTRETTIARKLEQAKELREKGAFFKTMLGAAVMGIDERVAKIEGSLRTSLGVVQARSTEKTKAA
jgi:hypothetical protein